MLCSVGMIDPRTLDKYRKEAKDMGRENVGYNLSIAEHLSRALGG